LGFDAGEAAALFARDGSDRGSSSLEGSVRLGLCQSSGHSTGGAQTVVAFVKTIGRRLDRRAPDCSARPHFGGFPTLARSRKVAVPSDLVKYTVLCGPNPTSTRSFGSCTRSTTSPLRFTTSYVKPFATFVDVVGRIHRRPSRSASRDPGWIGG